MILKAGSKAAARTWTPPLPPGLQCESGIEPDRFANIDVQRSERTALLSRSDRRDEFRTGLKLPNFGPAGSFDRQRRFTVELRSVDN